MICRDGARSERGFGFGIEIVDGWGRSSEVVRECSTAEDTMEESRMGETKRVAEGVRMRFGCRSIFFRSRDGWPHSAYLISDLFGFFF